MPKFASGKHALGICDSCGWQFALRDLRKNSYGLLVCPTDFDGSFDLVNHPQNGPFPVAKEGIGLRDPRPDVALASDDDASWTPAMSRAQQQE